MKHPRKVPAVALPRQARALAALAAVLVLSVPWMALPEGWRMRRGLALIAWRTLLAGFGIRVRPFGQAAPGVQIVAANHVSWLDIAVLGRLLDAGFVAKADVAGWPVIGLLARRYGCAFIERDRRASVAGQASTLRAQIEGRRPVILFPEATTGPGDRVLPFRSSLFAAASGSGDGHGSRIAVQPVAIVYRRHDGAALSAEELRRVAWLDDDALLPHAMALAASGGVAVEVHFEVPVLASCRKVAARQCQQAIAVRLAADDRPVPACQPATANRAA